MANEPTKPFFSDELLLKDGKPVEFPPNVNLCAAVIGSSPTVQSPSDGVGVVFVGVAVNGQTRPLTVLDWAFLPIDGGLTVGCEQLVFPRLAELSNGCGAGLVPPAIIVESTEVGRPVRNWLTKDHDIRQVRDFSELLNSQKNCANRGLEDLAVRAFSTGFILGEHKVKISTPAYEKTADANGVVSNHFLDQYRNYRMGQAHSAGTELVSAFCTACTLLHFNLW